MPHKHTRRERNDRSIYDLPPSTIAKPLPVGKSRDIPASSNKSGSKRSRRLEDDTPRAFARVMHLQSGGKKPIDLDDGDNKHSTKKRKRIDGEPAVHDAAQEVSTQENKKLKILPGESMSDFSARVNQALPITGLGNKAKRVAGAPRDRQTKLEKKIQRKIATWRTEEARRQEVEEEQRDLAELDDAEHNNAHEQDARERGRNKKTAGLVNSVKKGDPDDPWAVLRSARDAPKGIFDVAQAPPSFTRIPREIFKIRNGARVDTADVPNTAGSLRQREELGTTRKNIIESYRRIMDAKRGKNL